MITVVNWLFHWNINILNSSLNGLSCKLISLGVNICIRFELGCYFSILFSRYSEYYDRKSVKSSEVLKFTNYQNTTILRRRYQAVFPALHLFCHDSMEILWFLRV